VGSCVLFLLLRSTLNEVDLPIRWISNEFDFSRMVRLLSAQQGWRKSSEIDLVTLRFARVAFFVHVFYIALRCSLLSGCVHGARKSGVSRCSRGAASVSVGA